MFTNISDYKTSLLLYARLSKIDVQIIRSILTESMNLPMLSANQLLQQLRSNGVTAAIFKPLRDFLAYVEGVYSYSYKDGGKSGKGKMTIGIGLNIQPPKGDSASALFYALDPTRNWDFPQMQEQIGYPNPHLTDTQINQLLYLTLVGVTNSQGKYAGLTQQLIHRLKLCGLSDAPYLPNQLIALQSLAFNAPALIGQHMCDALKSIGKYSDIEPLIEIIDYSNASHDVGLQNRRLKEAAMFHGKSADPTLDVQLTWRRLQNVTYYNFPNHPFVLINGPVISGLPSGTDQTTFQGGTNVTILPGYDWYQLDQEIYGTPGNDYLTSSPGNAVIFSGDGDDIIDAENIQSDHPLKIVAPYYAGGNGYDTYMIKSFLFGFAEFTPIIYDSDLVGRLILNGDLLQGISVNDILVVNGTNYVASCCIANEENQLIVGTSKSPFFGLTLLNYKGGSFNIVHAKPLSLKIPSSCLFSTASTALLDQTGNWNMAVVCSDASKDVLYVQTYNPSGNMNSNVPLSIGGDTLSQTCLVPSPDESFSVYWVSEIVAGPNITLWQASFNFEGKLISQSTVANCYGNSDCITAMYAVQIKNNLYTFEYTTEPMCNCTTSDLYQMRLASLDSRPSKVTNNHRNKHKMRDRNILGKISIPYINYTFNLNNGNTLFLRSDNINSYALILDQRGSLVGEEANITFGTLQPSVVFDNGDVVLMTSEMVTQNAIYINASAIQPPYQPSKIKRPALDSDQSARYLSKPSIVEDKDTSIANVNIEKDKSTATSAQNNSQRDSHVEENQLEEDRQNAVSSTGCQVKPYLSFDLFHMAGSHVLGIIINAGKSLKGFLANKWHLQLDDWQMRENPTKTHFQQQSAFNSDTSASFNFPVVNYESHADFSHCITSDTLVTSSYQSNFSIGESIDSNQPSYDTVEFSLQNFSCYFIFITLILHLYKTVCDSVVSSPHTKKTANKKDCIELENDFLKTYILFKTCQEELNKNRCHLSFNDQKQFQSTLDVIEDALDDHRNNIRKIKFSKNASCRTINELAFELRDIRGALRDDLSLLYTKVRTVRMPPTIFFIDTTKQYPVKAIDHCEHNFDAQKQVYISKLKL